MLLIEAQLKLLSSEAQGPILRFVRCLVFAPARHQTNRCTLKAGAHFELGAAFCSACVCSRYRSKQTPLIEHVLVALMRFFFGFANLRACWVADFPPEVEKLPNAARGMERKLV